MATAPSSASRSCTATSSTRWRACCGRCASALTFEDTTTQSDELRTWRRTERTRLLGLRESADARDRERWRDAITRSLIEGFGWLEGRTIGFCWPYRAEPDPRYAIRHFRARGARAALPVVEAKGAPLAFREWWPGVPTAPGVFDLPVPQGTATMRPDALIVPPVGFDAHGYRLGYGGGYFDRTLAAIEPQPLAIAVAFEVSRMPTIHPQPHDVPMDFVVTECAIYRVTQEGLKTIEGGSANEAAADIAARRARRGR